MDKFICKDGGSNYYLKSGGMGSFCTPEGHADRSNHIVEMRGGHEMGSMSITAAAEADYLPARVKSTAQKILRLQSLNVTEEFISSCYAYFRNCYSPDGMNRSASSCLIPGQNCTPDKPLPPEHHLGYLMVKEYDPNHTPRLDLIENPPTSFSAL